MTTSDKPSEDASYQGSGGKDSPEESDEEQEDVKVLASTFMENLFSDRCVDITDRSS